MQVLHVLHHSIPFNDGYSIRSKNIVEFQKKLGLNPVVVTSAHHEIEVNNHLTGLYNPKEEISGLVYHRTQLPNGSLTKVKLNMPFIREKIYMDKLYKSINRLLDEKEVDIIHAHSPIICGIPAAKAAISRNIPIVYEVRAFWGMEKPIRHRINNFLEYNLFNKVNAIAVISKLMIHEIVKKGGDSNKIHFIPNGVDSKHFVRSRKDGNLIKKYDLQKCTTIGFIGSFYRFEGLDCLIHAMQKIVRTNSRIKLVLVGDGEDTNRIKELVSQFDLTNNVMLAGRVPYSEVLKYYSIMDIMIYPRHDMKLTNQVTPLKPLEAMAMGVPVIGSDVGGIKELFNDGKVGILFKAGNSDDLAEKIMILANNEKKLVKLGEQARDYIKKERDWNKIITKYLDIYENILG